MCNLISASEIKQGDLLLIRMKDIKGLFAPNGVPGLSYGYFLYTPTKVDSHSSVIQLISDNLYFWLMSSDKICRVREASNEESDKILQLTSNEQVEQF